MEKQEFDNIITSILAPTKEDHIAYEKRNRDLLDKISQLDLSDDNPNIDKAIDEMMDIIAQIGVRDSTIGLQQFVSKLNDLGVKKETKIKFECFNDGMLTYGYKNENTYLEITVKKDAELFHKETVESLFENAIDKMDYAWGCFYVDNLRTESFDYQKNRMTRFKDNIG